MRDAIRERLAGDWRGIQGNFGPPGEQVDLTGIAAYANLDDLLRDPQVDLVDISLPTSLHADMAIRALEAGKHVLCEKPMALRLADCERMVAAAKKANRLLMIGHVLPFFPEYDWALKMIRSGEYGRVRGGAFRRVIADPTWIKNFWSPDHIGGPMLDLHVHDAHFIRLLFGMPQEVTTSAACETACPSSGIRSSASPIATWSSKPRAARSTSRAGRSRTRSRFTWSGRR